MSSNYLIQAVVFLVQLSFDIVILALLLRYLLAKVKTNSYNPLSEVIMKLTNPLLVPLRRVLPG